jgi:putative protein kinase ArgK-like GTPase of G3E family
MMSALHGKLAKGGHLKTLRADQSLRWFWTEVHAALADEIANDRKIAARAGKLEDAVREGAMLPDAAARTLIRAFRGGA